MSTRPGPLHALTEDAILDELTRRYREALLEDGVPERIRRRGWGRYGVEVVVEDYGITIVNVDSKTHHGGHRPRKGFPHSNAIP